MAKKSNSSTGTISPSGEGPTLLTRTHPRKSTSKAKAVGEDYPARRMPQDSNRGETELPVFDLGGDLLEGEQKAGSKDAKGMGPAAFYTVTEIHDQYGSRLYRLVNPDSAPVGSPDEREKSTKGVPRGLPETRPDAVLVRDVPVEPPDIKWKGEVPNFTQGRAGHTPVAICDHIMAGTLASTDGWFHNADSGVSAHFGIGRKGEIYQWVSVDDMAWANGLGYESDGRPFVLGSNGSHIIEKPDLSNTWMKQVITNRINPNYLTISIEHDGQTGEAFTEDEYKATLHLHRFLIQRYNIPPLREHFIGHFQVGAVNRAFCPGKAFPWDRLMNDLGIGTIPLTQVSYMASVPSVAMVRPGPGTSYNPGVKKAPGATKKFQVVGEAKGEAIRDTRRNRIDDTWAYFQNLDGISGFVTRAALDW
jgi:N-acetyl-anhydromuramyl-L-alanine amidase AmpD